MYKKEYYLPRLLEKINYQLTLTKTETSEPPKDDDASFFHHFYALPISFESMALLLEGSPS